MRMGSKVDTLGSLPVSHVTAAHLDLIMTQRTVPTVSVRKYFRHKWGKTKYNSFMAYRWGVNKHPFSNFKSA